MTSRRESVSSQAQADMDDLLAAVLPFAKQQLAKHGGFTPFGATVGVDGELLLRGAQDEPPRTRGAASVLAGLYAAVRADRANTRAAAFVACIEADGSDAIRVELEHADQAWMTVLMPYSTSRFRKTITYQAAHSAPVEPHVWTRRR